MMTWNACSNTCAAIACRPSAPRAATPEPAPVRTPVLTPVATPVPTPVRTPVQTPVSAPLPTPAPLPKPTQLPTPEPVSAPAAAMALLACILLAWAAPAAADTLYLKSGKVVRAEKIWEEGDLIKCRMYGAVIGYPLADALKIEKDDQRPPDDPLDGGRPTGAPAESPEEETARITADFFEADLGRVLGMIREASDMNFAVDPDVSGKVTLTIQEPLPWDEVLRVVLKMNGLAREDFGPRIIRIYRP